MAGRVLIMAMVESASADVKFGYKKYDKINLQNKHTPPSSLAVV